MVEESPETSVAKQATVAETIADTAEELKGMTVETDQAAAVEERAQDDGAVEEEVEKRTNVQDSGAVTGDAPEEEEKTQAAQTPAAATTQATGSGVTFEKLEGMHKGLIGGILTVEVVKNDITKERTDAITNAANGRLMHGGGVAGAISRAGGRAIDAESRQYVETHGKIPTG